MERRDNSRRPVSWRVRLWLAEALGFLEGRAVDASGGGLGIVMPLPASPRFITAGRQYRVEVTLDGEPVLQDLMTVRHVSGDKIGLQFAYRRPPLDAPEPIEPESIAVSDASEAR